MSKRSDYSPKSQSDLSVPPDSPQDDEQFKDSRKQDILNNQDKNQEPMEAYHPHGKHGPKKIKDYIFEFLMMFIAITGGFFMENIREHRVDRHKEKEYMVRLIGDIKVDTAKIKSIIRWNQKQMKGLDSLVDILQKPASELNAKEVIYFSKYMNDYLGFEPRDITITQLKNSAGLRLIENNSVSDSIVNYYSLIDYRHELNVKFNYRFLEETVKLELQFIDFNDVNNKSPWNINDSKQFKEFRNRCYVFKTQIGWDNHWLNDVYNRGASLLKLIEKEYDLPQ